MWSWCRVLVVAAAAAGVAACSNTAIQGYADRQLPAKPVQHIAAYVAAPTPLATSMQATIGEQARRHAAVAEDALTILPPTRQYTDAEVRKALAERGVDSVLVITVADSGVVSQYAGTIFAASYSGTAVGGMAQGSTTPTYSYSRQTQFSARLLDPNSGRALWVGSGQVDSGGGRGLLSRIVTSDSVSSSNAIGAIFADLQAKGLIGGGNS